MKDLALSIGTIAAFELLRWWAGVGVAFCVAIVALAFCMGILLGAGGQVRRHRDDLEHLRDVADEVSR